MKDLIDLIGDTQPATAQPTLPDWWPFALPPSLSAFYGRYECGAGNVGQGYIDIWSVSEFDAANDRAKHDPSWAKYLFFGSNGAGEHYGVTVQAGHHVFVIAPAISMDLRDILNIGDYEKFKAFINQGGFFECLNS